MSLRARLGGAINARPDELPGLLAAFTCVFAMFSSYSILRPIRETMGLTSGVETLPALFWGTFIAMLAMQPVYGWLTSRFRRTGPTGLRFPVRPSPRTLPSPPRLSPSPSPMRSVPSGVSTSWNAASNRWSRASAGARRCRR